MARSDTYVGIQNEINGGMTAVGKIIRDAQVFGLLDDAETCEGWNISRLDALLEEVNKEWDKYSCLVSNLPPELRERHQLIYSAAIERAKSEGWSGEVETKDET